MPSEALAWWQLLSRTRLYGDCLYFPASRRRRFLNNLGLIRIHATLPNKKQRHSARHSVAGPLWAHSGPTQGHSGTTQPQESVPRGAAVRVPVQLRARDADVGPNPVQQRGQAREAHLGAEEAGDHDAQRLAVEVAADGVHQVHLKKGVVGSGWVGLEGGGRA